MSVASSSAGPLRVAVLAHVRQPIRPPFHGGVEAHTWHLARGLAERGHEVTLLASGDSDAGVPLFATVDAHYERALPWRLHRGSEVLDTLQRTAFERAMRHLASNGFDVIHNNTLHPLPIRVAAEAGLAMLTSLHVPPFEALHEAVRGDLRRLALAAGRGLDPGLWEDARRMAREFDVPAGALLAPGLRGTAMGLARRAAGPGRLGSLRERLRRRDTAMSPDTRGPA